MEQELPSETPSRESPAATPGGEIARGIRAGVPVAVAYLPMAMAFGVLAAQTGLSFAQASAMSLFVYAGASQYAALGLIGGGASAPAIILATLVLNFRHFLMSMALSRRLPLRRDGPGAWAAPLGLGFGITDETFVVASLDARLTPRFFLGLMLTAYASWVAGTAIGAGFSSLIPPLIARGMGVALYAMFVAMLVPGVRRAWINGAVAVIGGVISWGATMLLPAVPAGWRVVIAILVASGLGAASSRKETGP
jgi:4-azaleucine resistance transporter AzlC